jgi:uncharacterized protein YdbL (DUF1318 family)
LGLAVPFGVDVGGGFAVAPVAEVAGAVGENNKGFLEQRASLSAEQTTVLNAENTDRRALYNILAGRLGLSVTVVGEQRATNLRERSAAGVWLQGADGVWYKK